jgi:putative molybdopterin biosynthesis protein
MAARDIQLQYTFGDSGQRGADVANPLFDLLTALRDHGSIQQVVRVSGASYRHVWGQLKHWEAVLEQPLVVWTQGQPARLTGFAQRLLWAEARARTRLTPHIEALRAELERVMAEALDGSQQVLPVLASHDLALPYLREIASAAMGLHLDLRFAGSMDALRALAEGRCAVAGFHVPVLAHSGTVFARALKPLLKPGRHKLIACLRRTQGLIVAPGNPLGLTGFDDVVLRAARFVHRQPGSGTRLLTQYLLHERGLQIAALNGADGASEHSHIAVAAAVAVGDADAGLGIEAAAHQFGLGFVPLVAEDYFLVCLHDALDSPGVTLLRSVLSGARWASALAALVGYANAPAAGEVLALTRALPWWRFRQGKGAGT